MLIAVTFAVSFPLRLAVSLFSSTHRAFFYNTFLHLDGLLAGMCLALLIFSKKITEEKFKPISTVLLISLTLLSLAIVIFVPSIVSNGPQSSLMMTVVAILGSVLLLSVMYNKRLSGLFSNPLLVHIGKLTYGMYLFHSLAQFIASNYILKPFVQGLRGDQCYFAWFIYMLLSLFLTWLMAFISWHLLEKHFYSMRYRFSRIYSGFGVEKLQLSDKHTP